MRRPGPILWGGQIPVQVTEFAGFGWGLRAILQLRTLVRRPRERGRSLAANELMNHSMWSVYGNTCEVCFRGVFPSHLPVAWRQRAPLGNSAARRATRSPALAPCSPFAVGSPPRLGSRSPGEPAEDRCKGFCAVQRLDGCSQLEPLRSIHSRPRRHAPSNGDNVLHHYILQYTRRHETHFAARAG